MKEVVNEIRAKKEAAVGFNADISEEVKSLSCLQLALSEWGLLDILIYNAGVFTITDTTDKYSQDAFEYLLKNNLKSTFMMTKFAIPELKK